MVLTAVTYVNSLFFCFDIEKMFYETASFFVDNSLTEKRQRKGFNGRRQQHVKLKATLSVN